MAPLQTDIGYPNPVGFRFDVISSPHARNSNTRAKSSGGRREVELKLLWRSFRARSMAFSKPESPSLSEYAYPAFLSSGGLKAVLSGVVKDSIIQH